MGQVLGAGAMDCDVEEEPASSRPWAIYTEDLSVHAGRTTLVSRDDGGWTAAADLFSIDTPLLLSFVVEQGTRVGLLRAGRGVADDDDDSKEDDS